MKLLELALKVNASIDHSQEEIAKVKDFFVSTGTLLKKIEGEKYKLIGSDKSVGLFTQDDDFVGFIQYSDLDSNIIALDKIFIVKDFRNSKVAKIFLFWFKIVIQKDIFIGGAIFVDGHAFVKSLADDDRFALTAFNTRTKEKTNFDASKLWDGRHFTGVLLESIDIFSGMYDNSLPGEKPGTRQICLEIFSD